MVWFGFDLNDMFHVLAWILIQVVFERKEAILIPNMIR